MRAIQIAAVLILASAGAASAQSRGYVIANGGNTSSGGGRVVHATVGQPVVGLSGAAVNRLCHGYWCFGGTRVVSVDPSGEGLPREITFGLPTPSPSRGDVSFALALPADSEVRLAVFDVAGREIGEPLTLHLAAGHHQLRWNSLDRAPGVFFSVLEVNGELQGKRRIVMVK